jgi:MoaA/NifB/PqqE/SkfB family radical SAM enzyme
MLSVRLVRRALTTRFVDHRPFILSHLLTARCNADCHTCLWKRPARAKVDELSTDEVAALYRDAAAAGFCALVLWGGEPLLRRDTGTVLRAAREAGLNTTLITNGWWLEERADEVLPWVSRLMVSVDGIGARHDEIRRLPGLFARLDRGLGAVRRGYPGVVVILNAVLSRLNIDQLEEIARYGTGRADYVAFQAMDVSDYGYALRQLDLGQLRLDPEEEAIAARRLAALKRQGFPVSDSNAYLARLGPGPDARRYRCHFKKVCLRVEPNGDVLDCTRQAIPLANVRHTPLRALCGSPAFREFQRRAEGCNRCRDAAVVEVSHMWEGRLETIWHAVSTLA